MKTKSNRKRNKARSAPKVAASEARTPEVGSTAFRRPSPEAPTVRDTSEVGSTAFRRPSPECTQMPKPAGGTPSKGGTTSQERRAKSPTFRGLGRISAIASVCILAAVAVSSPGRHGVARALSIITSRQPSGVTPDKPASGPPLTVEKRAETAAGWAAGIRNSISKGTITYYDRTGAKTGEASIALYVSYPDDLRVEIDPGDGKPETAGFSQGMTWSSAKDSLTATESRDIRAWLRTRPERLFVKYAAGSKYREAGAVLEDHIPKTPWQAAQDPDQPAHLDQVELIDDLAPVGQAKNGGAISDLRRTYYYVNEADGTVRRVKWMEPDDPAQDTHDGGTPNAAIQVDFGDYRKVAGAEMPFDLVHWWGGKVDYRITLSYVRVNQAFAHSLFEHQ
jgi:hypothetical protein